MERPVDRSQESGHSAKIDILAVAIRCIPLELSAMCLKAFMSPDFLCLPFQIVQVNLTIHSLWESLSNQISRVMSLDSPTALYLDQHTASPTPRSGKN